MITEKQMMHGMDYIDENVSGWLMSEKLDGCRAYWDGAVMWSRGGKIINIPPAMLMALPIGVALDGEIHAGRNGYEIARQAVQYNRWADGIEFSVFDAPAHAGDFTARYDYISNLLTDEGVVNYIHHDVCDGIDDAVDYMELLQSLYGGEGVVLRDPANIYKRGRTEQILKLKWWP